jgi:outer membrane protein TolC
MQRIAVARINTLLRMPPDSTLPRPPERLDIIGPLPPAEVLREVALAQRPALAAQTARLSAARSAVDLACKERYPDLEVVARYDTFWQEEPLRSAVGVNVNPPIRKIRRRAAVSEAMSRVAERQAELQERIDEIQYDVQAAYARVVESRDTVMLYEATILPSAQSSVESARSSYVTGELDFLRLIEAQRQLTQVEEQSFEARADYFRRLAELERLVAVPLDEIGASGEEVAWREVSRGHSTMPAMSAGGR